MSTLVSRERDDRARNQSFSLSLFLSVRARPLQVLTSHKEDRLKRRQRKAPGGHTEGEMVTHVIVIYEWAAGGKRRRHRGGGGEENRPRTQVPLHRHHHQPHSQHITE